MSGFAQGGLRRHGPSRCFHICSAVVIAAVLTATVGTAAAQDGEPKFVPPIAGADSSLYVADRVWTQVLVVTGDGWKFADVSVRWTAAGDLVRVTRQDGSWRNFAPEAIEYIYADDGSDLTAEISAARPKGGGSTRKSQPHGEVGQVDSADADAARPTLGDHLGIRKPFAYAITFGGGYGIYTGEYYDLFDAAPSIQACVRLRTGDRSWMTLSYRRQGGGSIESMGDGGIDPTYVEKVSFHVSEFFVAVGLAVGKPRNKHLVPYLEFGLALLHHVAELELDGTDFGGSSENKLGPVFQGGAVVGLGDHAVLDLGIDITYKPEFVNDDGSSGAIFGIHAGFGIVSW